MFCLDYAVAFATHYALLRAHREYSLRTAEDEEGCDADAVKRISILPSSFAGNSALGALAGTATAAALYPIDYVRMATVKNGCSRFALGVVPYMACYFGVFFTWGSATDSCDANCWRRKIAVATASTLAGTAAELPFDLSKHSMSGSVRLAGLTAALRIPLGAMLLLAYDHILTHPHSRLAI
mmetsp:Transcript_11778/g.31693  ORF Transcript_11778/g.31693 Transcript_11778/m.31693 type:complete len:182 (+) Transcript_11778:88-633(+)